MKKEIRKSDMVMSVLSNSFYDLPSPSSISYMWNFGSLLGVFLLIQIVTGLFLAIHFSSDTELSFLSIIHIMRDVKMGWMIRFFHSNGASLFFFLLYFHVGRGLFYGSYKSSMVWVSGVSIFLVSMMIAFLGYVLPWGQMSFWAATVITNLLSAVPYIGKVLVEWVWGGFAVGNPTLIRFFSFHFIFPFVLVFLVILHLYFLHENGSGNPFGVSSDEDSIEFHPYFLVKDVVGMLEILLLYMIISFFFPYVFMDAENFIPSNPLVTPVHIQPEWYFLFAYCILRSVSSSIGGVMALIMSVVILYLFPILYKGWVKSMSMKSLESMMFWTLIVVWIVLTWIGSKEVEDPYSDLGKKFSFLYFFVFFVFWVVFEFSDWVKK